MKAKELCVLSGALYVVAAFAAPAKAEVVFAADFNSQPDGDLVIGSRPGLPQSIIVDPGATVRVVPSAANLTDRPILLHAIVGSLASVSFFNPVQLTSGLWRVSWDSAVMGPPVDNAADQYNLGIISGTATSWGIKYAQSGQFSIQDAGGFHTAGNFIVGQRDHFDLRLDLDSSSYNLFVNGDSLLTGNLVFGAFDFTDVMVNGRGGMQLPDLAFDNFIVQSIPEPNAVAFAAMALMLLLVSRKHASACGS